MSFAPLKTLAACLAAAVLAAGLAACGSSSPSSTTASSGGRTGGPNAAKFHARVNLAKCLRAHGVNVPDPAAASSGYGRSLLQITRSYPQAEVIAAEHSCRQYLVHADPNIDASPAQQAQRLRQKVQYAACMRSHGIDIPDPSSTAAPGTGSGKLPSSVNRNSPAVIAANTACASFRRKHRTTAGGSASTGS